MKTFLVLCFVLCSFVILCNASDNEVSTNTSHKRVDGKALNLLNSRNFFGALEVGGDQPWFLAFYLPNCQYCIALSAVWAELSVARLNKTHVGVISCETDDPLCIVWDVNTVPAMIYLKDGQAYIYDGTRDVSDMIDFMESRYTDEEPIEPPTFEELKLEVKKDLWKKNFDPEKLPSSTTVGAILVSIVLSLLICCGYCCAPKPEAEEPEENKDKKSDATDKKKDKPKEKTETIKSSKTNDSKSDTRKRK